MGGNPIDSEWYNTPADKRVRRKWTFTLSDAAVERLDALAAKSGEPKSQIVEGLIMASVPRGKRPK